MSESRRERGKSRSISGTATSSIGLPPHGSALLPHAEPAELRVRVYACFGLINSTPHSVRGVRWSVPDGPAAPVLEAMALAALTADADA